MTKAELKQRVERIRDKRISPVEHAETALRVIEAMPDELAALLLERGLSQLHGQRCQGYIFYWDRIGPYRCAFSIATSEGGVVGVSYPGNPVAYVKPEKLGPIFALLRPGATLKPGGMQAATAGQIDPG